MSILSTNSFYKHVWWNIQQKTPPTNQNRRSLSNSLLLHICRLRESLDTLAEKLEIDGPTTMDSPNLALCVSESAETVGCGRDGNDTILLLDASHDDAGYMDSIVLPLDDMCEQGHGCVRNGRVIHSDYLILAQNFMKKSVLPLKYMFAVVTWCSIRNLLISEQSSVWKYKTLYCSNEKTDNILC